MRFARFALVTCSLMAIGLQGCGSHTLVQPSIAPATVRQAHTVAIKGVQYNQDDLDRYTNKVAAMVLAYDHGVNGAIKPAEIPAMYMHDQMDSDARFDEIWILRTRVYFDRYRALKDGVFSSLDTDHDGKLTRSELINGYLDDRDTNQDGRLGIWERVKAFVMTPSMRFEDKWVVETHRSQWFEYAPIRDMNARNRERPTPPPMPATVGTVALNAPPDQE